MTTVVAQGRRMIPDGIVTDPWGLDADGVFVIYEPKCRPRGVRGAAAVGAGILAGVSRDAPVMGRVHVATGGTPVRVGWYGTVRIDADAAVIVCAVFPFTVETATDDARTFTVNGIPHRVRGTKILWV